MGLRGARTAAYDATFARRAAAGFAPKDADKADGTGRSADRWAAVQAWASTVEIGLALARRRPARPLPLMPDGFTTEGQGFGHAVVGTTVLDEPLRFATDGLGLVQSS